MEQDLHGLRAEGCDARIASGGGRMVTTMDRYDADWAVVERGWNAHVHGQADHVFASAGEAVEVLGKDFSDQNMPPFVIAADNEPVGTVNENDAAVFWNFRGDRSIEIARAFEESEFKEFDRGQYDPASVAYAGMYVYH